MARNTSNQKPFRVVNRGHRTVGYSALGLLGRYATLEEAMARLADVVGAYDTDDMAPMDGVAGFQGTYITNVGRRRFFTYIVDVNNTDDTHKALLGIG